MGAICLESTTECVPQSEVICSFRANHRQLGTLLLWVWIRVAYAHEGEICQCARLKDGEWVICLFSATEIQGHASCIPICSRGGLLRRIAVWLLWKQARPIQDHFNFALACPVASVDEQKALTIRTHVEHILIGLQAWRHMEETLW